MEEEEEEEKTEEEEEEEEAVVVEVEEVVGSTSTFSQFAIFKDRSKSANIALSQ